MRILIRRLENRKGTTAFSDRELDAPQLRIGRGTDQELQLSDMRVALAHAEIELAAGGPYRILAKTANGVWVNGGPCPGARLGFNDTVDFGHFRLTVMRPDLGFDLAVLVEQREATSEKKPDRPKTPAYITELSQTRLSRRGMAWGGFMLVLVAMFLIPLTLRYGTSPASAPAKVAALPSDHVWSSGPMSSAHAYIETDCATCHVQPFEQVRNDACLTCHDTIRHHVADAKFLGQAEFAAAQCTDCHREHNGPEGTIVRDASLCTDCHADPKARFAGSQLDSVTNFSDNHPAFSPLVARWEPSAREFSFAPVTQGRGAELREDTNLVFPHDLHLDGKGIDAPEGTRTLGCADCHVPDRGQISFAPVSMEAHCADCHSLTFDKDNPERVVPHGQPAEVAAVLRDYFASQALSGEVRGLATLDQLPPSSERRRPGPVRPRADRAVAARWSEQQGEQAVRDVFNSRICTYCHVVSPGTDDALPWTIAPLALDEHAMRGARFDHKPHATESCTSCHAAETSKQSSDVLLPAIDPSAAGLSGCRDCHGDPGSSAKVGSACIDCHGYHIDEMPLWDPKATERKRKTEMVQPQLKVAGGAQ